MDDKLIGEDNALAENTDILRREGFITGVLSVINSYKGQTQGLSFSIAGGWGYGKSFILDRVQEQLADNWIVLRYDSWKYDYYEEPLVALISSISDHLQEHSSEIDADIVKNVAKAAARMVWYCAIEAAGPFSFILKAADKVWALFQRDEKTDKQYDSSSSLEKKLYIIKKLLTKIGGKNHHVVLMIDELDRCLPAYQVKVLERIHHVVNGSNCVVIYALNPNQLSATIQQIYGGNEERVTAYLKKFLDFSLNIDAGRVSEKVEQKYASDIALFNSPLDGEASDEDSRAWFHRVCMWLLSGLEIRVQEKLWKKRRIIHDIVFSKEDKPLPLIYLTCELMLLAMNEWKKRAYIPNHLKEIDWSQKKTMGAFLGDGFRSNTDTDTVIELPETVQIFGTGVISELFPDNYIPLTEKQNPKIYWIESRIPKSVIFIAAAWTYANDNPYLQLERQFESTIDVADDKFIHLKRYMKDFNNFAKIMS